MTMHLVGPYLTTTGKKKGRAKFRNADAANKARKNTEAWQELLNKWDIKVETKTTKVRKSTGFNPVVRNAPVVDPRRFTNHIPSLDTRKGIAVKKEVSQYTGTAMLGIGQLHKSNAIPVFSQEDAIDISKMRRG